MPHFMERTAGLSDVLILKSRRENRPLSLLAVDPLEIEHLAAWENWVRRLNVFASDNKTYYHLVNDSMGLDLYQRFNYRIRQGDWTSISTDLHLAWPFDAVNVTITERSWSEVYHSPDVWVELLKEQCVTGSEFLLIAQGFEDSIVALNDILGSTLVVTRLGVQFRSVRFHRFVSGGTPAAVRVWSSSPTGVTKRRNRKKTQDQELISDLILWGEEAW